MKKLILIGLTLVASSAAAQSAEPLIFREKTFDFGAIQETTGIATHEFLFTNSANRPVKILNVQPSCGCTTPGWTKNPVQPGKTGAIKVNFDPKGRPGYFNKTLTILTDLDATPIVLSIKGTVEGDRVGENDLKVSMGNLWLKSRSFTMGTVYLNRDPATKTFAVKNGGSDPIRFLSVAKPEYVKVEMPDELAPGARDFIRVIYDARARRTYGFVSDNITFKTTDKGNETMSISLFASLEEYYAPPTTAELATAPQAVLRESSLDLGQYPVGASLERKVTLYNKGKKELKIKALTGNCSCITAESEKRSIRPGDSTQLRILFKPQARGGTQQKAVAVYTNDPRNPVQVLSVSVYIND